MAWLGKHLGALGAPNIKNRVLLALLLVHVGWISIHVSLVANEQINPWKLGGYGMYTVPNPRPRVRLYEGLAEDRRLVKGGYYSRAFADDNRRFVFRCTEISQNSLENFFRKNRKLIGKQLTVVVEERAFLHDPIRTEKRVRGVTQIKWKSDFSFDYRGKICGDQYLGSGSILF